MTQVGDVLKEALRNKEIGEFIWKWGKEVANDRSSQKTEKLIDMTPEKLIQCYQHCQRMLYNSDPKNLGRSKVFEQVNSEMNKCNTELLLRYYENSYLKDDSRRTITRSPGLIIDLRTLQSKNPEIEDWNKILISNTTDLPAEFSKISVQDLLDGCTDCLGAFNKERITLTFITKMGLWFNKAEENELKGANNLEKVAYAKMRLHLPNEFELKLNERGLSFHEMRAIIILPKKQKYSDMTTEQLLTLRNKILPRFQGAVLKHIKFWNNMIKQIKMVAKYKNIELPND